MRQRHYSDKACRTSHLIRLEDVACQSARALLAPKLVTDPPIIDYFTHAWTRTGAT